MCCRAGTHARTRACTFPPSYSHQPPHPLSLLHRQHHITRRSGSRRNFFLPPHSPTHRRLLPYHRTSPTCLAASSRPRPSAPPSRDHQVRRRHLICSFVVSPYMTAAESLQIDDLVHCFKSLTMSDNVDPSDVKKACFVRSSPAGSEPLLRFGGIPNPLRCHKVSLWFWFCSFLHGRCEVLLPKSAFANHRTRPT